MANREAARATVQHITVLLAEAVESLTVRPAGTYVDGTFGRGGHSRKILECLGATGRLIALDCDAAAVEAAAQITDPRFEMVRTHFSDLSEVLAQRQMTHVDGILLDLGVSSPQIDEAARGFSFRFDGPLDMRMDVDRGEPAGAWLAHAEMDEIARVIREYGEERFARQIAQSIVTARTISPIQTTRQLAQIVASAVRTREPGQDPATRTFQALRIYLNRELEEVAAVLPQALEALSIGGRLVVISFHSLEDRVVKQFMRQQSTPPEIPRGMAVRERERPSPRLRLIGRAMRPSSAEIAANPRSRSAVMRVAERTAA